MKTVLFLVISLSTLSVYAQTGDSTKAKSTTTLSKYEQPSRFGSSPSQPSSLTGSVPTFPSSLGKPARSEYRYSKDGRVVGGKTTLFRGDKKKD